MRHNERMRWVSLPAIVLALSACARRPNHTAAYIADGCLAGVGGLGLALTPIDEGGEDPGLGPVHYIYIGAVAVGAIGAGLTYLVNAGEDSSEE